jgi:hypothetical protein
VQTHERKPKLIHVSVVILERIKTGFATQDRAVSGVLEANSCAGAIAAPFAHTAHQADACATVSSTGSQFSMDKPREGSGQGHRELS